jgi:hypothetical protein
MPPTAPCGSIRGPPGECLPCSCIWENDLWGPGQCCHHAGPMEDDAGRVSPQHTGPHLSLGRAGQLPTLSSVPSNTFRVHGHLIPQKLSPFSLSLLATAGL